MAATKWVAFGCVEPSGDDDQRRIKLARDRHQHFSPRCQVLGVAGASVTPGVPTDVDRSAFPLAFASSLRPSIDREWKEVCTLVSMD